jgi:molybdopterin-containing oxidoreductase family membrane subunit
VPTDAIRSITPFAVPEVDEILPQPRSRVRFFALAGAGAGTVTGFAFTILTMLSWPLIVGGKPIVSIPPFIIIAFALTILFGSLSTFLGFLILSRLPSIRTLRSGEDYGNAFVILIEEGRRR